ncbi:MAG: glycosyltransferase family 2 protein [Akkermansiaceae bacterium]|nr:glycosyltransferase family 2 protein [Akkermansiaceae bacterium]
MHNRREVTRACLTRLDQQGEFGRSTVCIVDDACTDGTRAMLAADFPRVRTVDGNGSLFWGGGILEGMKYAHAQGAEIFFWLNDDCIPEQGAIGLLVDRARETHGICGGVCYDPADPSVITYSGELFGHGTLKPAAGEILPVDMINGNLVAVHRDVVDRIGFIPGDRLPHYGGDSVYSLRARRAGIPCEVHGSARATNPPNPYLSRFGIDKPARLVWKEPFRTASILYWPTYWRFLRETFGWQAYLRWPFYIKRLIGHYLRARRRQRQQQPLKS